MWAHQDLDKRLVKFQHQHPIVNRRRKPCTVVTSQHHRHLHSRIAVTKHVILLCLLFAAASSDAFLARAAGSRCTAARHSPSHEGLLGPRGQLETSTSASDFAHSDLRHEPFGDEDLALPCVRIPKSSQAVLRSFEDGRDTYCRQVQGKGSRRLTQCGRRQPTLAVGPLCSARRPCTSFHHHEGEREQCLIWFQAGCSCRRRVCAPLHVGVSFCHMRPHR